jgi:hypothetical protein
LRSMAALLLMVLLGGCTATAGSSTTPTPILRATPPATRTARIPSPTPTVVVGKPFASFLHIVCSALASGNATTIIDLLPYYQYNSGLRYGTLGGGEGQSADPSLMRTWLASARPHCVTFTPGVMGHGTVLTVGWKTPAPASIIELDMFNGHWKVNDFTFAGQSALERAMKTSSPILTYRG